MLWRHTLSLLLAISVTGASCDGPNGPDDAGIDSGPGDGFVDAWQTDAADDSGTVRPRDAGLLPCEQPAYYSPFANRIRVIELSEDGQPGSGLDVDNDPSTCRPVGDCSAGVDNQAGELNVEGCISSPLTPSNFNYLLDLILNGDPPQNWLVEAHGLVLAGTDSVAPFALTFHNAHWISSPLCTTSASILEDESFCDFFVDDSLLAQGTCEPLSVLPNAEIHGGVLTAGGDGYSVWLTYQTLGLTAGMVVHHARVEAQITMEPGGLFTVAGVLAGVICPDELVSAIAAVVNIDPQTCNMAAKIPAPDLEIGCDANADPDGISAGFTFETRSAQILGLLRQ